MTRHLPHIRKHAPTHVHFAALVFAAVLALTGVRSNEVKPDPHEMPTVSSMGIEAAALDGSGRAVRDVNITVLAERVSERKGTSDHDFDVRGASRIGDPPTPALAGAAALGNAVPPRLLFYLHSALLI